jgi:hypothetical protein
MNSIWPVRRKIVSGSFTRLANARAIESRSREFVFGDGCVGGKREGAERGACNRIEDNLLRRQSAIEG